jgi:small subunit ribosomal protein S11
MANQNSAQAKKAKSAKQNVSSNVVKKTKKPKKKVSNGKAHIIATFNNTLVYITDLEGNTLGWSTSGGQGFKGSRKSTPYAAQVAAQHAAQSVKENYGMGSIDIIIKGPGPGRESAARALASYFKVNSITDATGIPHNGCRASKERRV